MSEVPEEVTTRGIALYLLYSFTSGRQKTVLLVKCPDRSDSPWTLSPQEGFHNLAVSLCFLSWTVVHFFPPAAFSFSSDASFSVLMYLRSSCEDMLSGLLLGLLMTACKLALQQGTLMKYITLRCIFSLLHTVYQFTLSPTIWTLEHLDQFQNYGSNKYLRYFFQTHFSQMNDLSVQVKLHLFLHDFQNYPENI